MIRNCLMYLYHRHLRNDLWSLLWNVRQGWKCCHSHALKPNAQKPHYIPPQNVYNIWLRPKRQTSTTGTWWPLQPSMLFRLSNWCQSYITLFLRHWQWSKICPWRAFFSQVLYFGVRLEPALMSSNSVPLYGLANVLILQMFVNRSERSYVILSMGRLQALPDNHKHIFTYRIWRRKKFLNNQHQVLTYQNVTNSTGNQVRLFKMGFWNPCLWPAFVLS